jgi:hypothetical protein
VKPQVDAKGKVQLLPAREPSQDEVFDTEVGRHALVDGRRYAKVKEPTDRNKVARARRLRQAAHMTALRADGWSVNDIADKYGYASATVVRYLMEFRRTMAPVDVEQELDKLAVPLATENLIHGLLAGDKDYTLETLKGRGQFKRHSADGPPRPESMPPLTIEFITPPGMEAAPRSVTGSVVGRMALPAARRTGVQGTDVQVPAPPSEPPSEPSVLDVPQADPAPPSTPVDTPHVLGVPSPPPKS